MTALSLLLSGEGPAVLQSCRFEGLGGLLYGRRAVSEALKSVPFGPPILDVETDRLGLWLDDDQALIADLAKGGIQRIWLLGRRLALSLPPSVKIPIDPDLTQVFGAVRFDPGDHPEVAHGDAARLITAVADWPSVGLSAPRPVILRAVSFHQSVAALVRLEGETEQGASHPVALNALIVVGPSGVERRMDEAGRTTALAQPWAPRL